MDLTLTLVLMLAAVALAALFGWLGARPPEPARGPRLAPWRMLMVVCAAGVLMLVVHVVNLMGFRTGR